MTGWFRDGSCRTNPADVGLHTVCCVVNEAFLAYTKAQGNDLSAPAPAHGFPGLKPGDHWCVCASRWLEAYEDGMAPPVLLEACEQSTLLLIPWTCCKPTPPEGHLGIFRRRQQGRQVGVNGP